MNDTNELLNQLRDIDVPSVSAGIALGWWLLGLMCVLLAAIVFIGLRVRRRRFEARLWQREARDELTAIKASVQNESVNAVLARCSVLARKVMLIAESREAVASVHGEAWLEAMDVVCGTPEFTQGMGRLLLDQPYQRHSEIAQQDLYTLFESLDSLISATARHNPVRRTSQ